MISFNFSTGSILVAAAKFGSFVMGSDIDYLMLHGKTKPTRVFQKIRAEDEGIKANMIQYSLQHLFVDVLVADFSNCPIGDFIQFDSIVTDREYILKLPTRSPLLPPLGKKTRLVNLLTQIFIMNFETKMKCFMKCVMNENGNMEWKPPRSSPSWFQNMCKHASKPLCDNPCTLRYPSRDPPGSASDQRLLHRIAR